MFLHYFEQGHTNSHAIGQRLDFEAGQGLLGGDGRGKNDFLVLVVGW